MVHNRWRPSRRAGTLRRALCRRYGRKLLPGFVDARRNSYLGSLMLGRELGDQAAIDFPAVIFLLLRTATIVGSGLPVLLLVVIAGARRRSCFLLQLLHLRLNFIDKPQIFVIAGDSG